MSTNWQQQINGLAPEYRGMAERVAAQIEGFHIFASLTPEVRQQSLQQGIEYIGERRQGFSDELAGWVQRAIGAEAVTDTLAPVAAARDGLGIALDGTVDVASHVAGLTNRVFTENDLWRNLSPAEAQRIGYHTAALIQEYDQTLQGRANSGLQGALSWLGSFAPFLGAVAEFTGQFLSYAFSGFSDQFELKSFDDMLAERQQRSETRSEIEVARGRAEYVREHLEGRGFSSDIAHMVSALDGQGHFIDTPSFVAPEDNPTIAAIGNEIQTENPDIIQQLANWREGRDATTLVLGGTMTTVALMATGRVVVPPVRAGGNLLLGLGEGLVRGVPGGTRVATNVSEAITRARSTPYEWALSRGAYADTVASTASRASVGFSRTIGRTVGKRIPLVGVVVAGAFAPTYLAAISQAEENDDINLTPQEANMLREIVALDTITAVGGFLTGETVNNGLREWLTNGVSEARIQEFMEQGLIPPTLTGMLLDSVGASREQLTRIESVHREIGGGDQLRLDRLTESRPVYEMSTSLLDTWRRYEIEYTTRGGSANPLADHPMIQGLQQDYAQDPHAARHPSFREYVESRYLGMHRMSSVSADSISPDQWQAMGEGVTKAQLFRDLIHQGPLYERLMQRSIAAGISLQDFERRVMSTLDEMASSAARRPNPNDSISHYMGSSIAVVNPSWFGLEANEAVLTPVTQQEAQAYRRLLQVSQEASDGFFIGIGSQEAVAPGHLERLTTMLASHQQLMETPLTAYARQHIEDVLVAQGAGAITVEHLQTAVAAQGPQSNSVFRQWLNNSEYASEFSAELRHSIEQGALTERMQLALEEYRTHLNQEAWGAYVTYRGEQLEEAMLLDLQTRGMLVYANQGSELMADALRVAYMMPTPESLRAQIEAGEIPENIQVLVQESAELRQAFEAALNDPVTAQITDAQSELYKKLADYMQAFNTHYYASPEAAAQRVASAQGAMSNDAMLAMLDGTTLAGVTVADADLPTMNQVGSTRVSNVTLEVTDAEEEFVPVASASAVSFDSAGTSIHRA